MLAFIASHEACCRMAVYAMQPAGSRTRPASREACRRAAVKPPAKSHVPRAAPAPYGRGTGSRSTAPCASHEACRRMAVYAMQPAGSHTRPASREARCRVAVKPRPTGMSHEQPPHSLTLQNRQATGVIPTRKGSVCPPPTAGEQSGDRQRREKALPFLKEEKSEHERART